MITKLKCYGLTAVPLHHHFMVVQTKPKNIGGFTAGGCLATSDVARLEIVCLLCSDSNLFRKLASNIHEHFIHES